MAYAQETDLRNRLGGDLIGLIADEDGDGTGDASILAAALEDASAEIDAALAARYVTPLTPVPANILRLTVDIAVYFLFIRRRGAIGDEHLNRWKEGREYLDALARGRAELRGAAERLGALKSDSTTREQSRRFDRSQLDPY